MTGLRIGNAEREVASARLSDHYAAGRVDDEEYAERLDAVWSARTSDDLSVVFHDLPAPVQRVEAPRQRRTRQRRQRSAFRAPLTALFIGVLLLALIIKVPWWVVLIAVVVLIKKSRHRQQRTLGAGRQPPRA